nr:MAG TPA: hypothetical protein [Caudoviricetes sp.]
MWCFCRQLASCNTRLGFPSLFFLSVIANSERQSFGKEHNKNSCFCLCGEWLINLLCYFPKPCPRLPKVSQNMI